MIADNAFQPPIGIWPGLMLLAVEMAAASVMMAAYTSAEEVRPHHVRYLKETQAKQAERLQTIIDDRNRYVAALSLAHKAMRLLVTLTIFVIVIAVANLLMESKGIASSTNALLVAGLLVAIPTGFVNFIVAELLPKNLAESRPHTVILRLFPLINSMGLFFAYPATLFLKAIEVLEARFRPVKPAESASQAEEEIKNLIEEAEESGELEEGERELIHSVFEFGDTVVREIMTPRVDLDAMAVQTPPADLAALMQASGHSRIPLFEGTDDQIVGVVHAKDLLMAMLGDPNVSLRRLMRPVLYVTENKNLQQLLKEMRHSRAHLAVVQDEFGGTAGIVTLEDVVEQLVGDIQDESDQEEEEVVETGSGFLVEGKTHIEDTNEQIGAELQSEEFDTIGGFVFGLFGRQPKLGEFVFADDFKFTVADTDGRRILKLKIERVELSESQTLSAIEDRGV